MTRRHLVPMIAIAALAAGCGSDNDSSTTAAPTTAGPTTTARPATTVAPTTTGPAPTTTVAPATTSAPTTTAAPTTTERPEVDRSTAMWPFGGDAERYDDPVAAARSFATEYLGFTDPVVGEFLAGDARSGEVEIRPIDTGPATTILVRQLGGEDTWSVLGSVTENIEVTSPGAMDAVRSPLALSGAAFEFEGHVAVEVRQDDSLGPLGEGFVTGGGSEMLPFEGTIGFDPPTRRGGVVLFRSFSAKDGSVWDAVAVRVRLEGGEFETDSCGTFIPGRPALAPDEVEVKVYFNCDPADPSTVAPIPVYRVGPRGDEPVDLAVRTLVAGPTPREREAGIGSWFSADTADAVRSVEVTEGHVVVDFTDLRLLIPNASSSAGSALLLSQLDSTVFQFPDVDSVEYRIEGSCADFGEWVQIGGCEPRVRPVAGSEMDPALRARP